MFLTTRNCRRQAGTITFLATCAVLVLVWYRFKEQRQMLEQKSFLDSQDDFAFVPASDKVKLMKATIAAPLNKKPKQNKPVKVEKRQKNVIHKPTECPFDFNAGLFTKNDDLYQSLKVDGETIHSEKFVSDRKPQKPVFGNPVIHLDPERYMLPVVTRGPNNQLSGLREAIHVAVRLNRTIVIPKFVKHRTDNQLKNGRYIHPGHRVDFYDLCHFVSCITLEQFREGCGNQVDVVFNLRYYSTKRISEMETDFGLRLSRSDKPGDINYIPPQRKDKSQTYFGPSEKEINNLFSTPDKCALYPHPYLNMKVRVKPGKRTLTRQSDLASFTDVELFSDIIRHTRAPKYIRTIADEFVQKIIGGNKFVSVHWRYDKKDWMLRCSKTDEKSKRARLCNEAELIQPVDVANAIISKVEGLTSVLDDDRQVYIASPVGEAAFISGVTKILQKSKVKVFSLKDLDIFIKNYYKSCKFFEPHYEDVESTIEMEICARGTVFVKATHSSWSNNVIESRRHNIIPGTITSKDSEIFELAITKRRERTKTEKQKKK